MKDDILAYFHEKHILSAQNVSRHLNLKRKRVSRFLNSSDLFEKTTFNDTGCGKFRTNTFKLAIKQL